MWSPANTFTDFRREFKKVLKKKYPSRTLYAHLTTVIVSCALSSSILKASYVSSLQNVKTTAVILKDGKFSFLSDILSMVNLVQFKIASCKIL
jgi:hypothetical protein